MAKQVGAVQFIGKVANVVGFRNYLSTAPSTNFVREKAASVSNPKTSAQAKQRAKVRPAQLFYDAFVNVLNHAFIPKGRASKNRLEFLSKAMSLDYVPDVMKGEFKIPFAPYQVSQGTLGLDRLTRGEHLNSAVIDVSAPYDGMIRFPLIFGDNFTFDSDIAELSGAILENNPSLVEGQEITFLAVMCERDNPNVRVSQVVSFVLDRHNSITIINPGLIWVHGTDDGVVLYTEIGNYVVLSAALIISSRSGGTWRYTNSFMALSGFALDGLDWDENAVVQSYMNASSAASSSELILQQADNESIEGLTITGVENVTFELATGVIGTPSFNKLAVATLVGSGVQIGRRVVVNSEGTLLYYANGVWAAVTLDNDGTTSPLQLTQTNLAGAPTVRLADVREAGF